MTSHQNLANYHTSFLNCKDHNSKKVFHVPTDQNVWLIMPIFEGGSLETIISSNFSSGIETESVILAILHDIIKGVNYLHKQRIIHRDIKTSNILINKDGDICLGDFGITLFVEEDIIQRFAGTLCWMAPENLGVKLNK